MRTGPESARNGPGGTGGAASGPESARNGPGGTGGAAGGPKNARNGPGNPPIDIRQAEENGVSRYRENQYLCILE